MAGPYRYVIGPVVERTEGGVSFYAPPDSCVSWIDLRGLPKMSTLGQAGCGLFAMPSGWSIPSEYHWLGGGEGDLRDLPFLAIDQAAFASLVGSTLTRAASTKLIDALTEQLTDAADPTGQEWNFPLIPASVPLLNPPEAQVVLAGHSVVRRLAFPGLGSRGWGSHVRDVERAKIADAKQAAKGRDPDLWRRQWGDLDRKYHGKVGSERADDLLSPAMRVFGRTQRPLQPQTTYTESFDGTDSATLGKDLTWTEQVGDWSNTSNSAECQTQSTLCVARADHDVSSADHYVQADVTNTSSGGNYQPNVRARSSASADTAYAGAKYLLSSYYLYKIVAGAYTTLSTGAETSSTPSTYKVHCNGSTITLYVNGVSKASVTDTAITTGTRGGIGAYFNAATKPRLDAWSIADLVSAPVAAFSGTPLSGSSPLSVAFTDSSSNSPTSWLWEKSSDGGATWSNFASGATSQNPTESFAAGTWAVRLTATNAGGSDGETKTAYVVVAAPSAKPVAGCYGLTHGIGLTSR